MVHNNQLWYYEKGLGWILSWDMQLLILQSLHWLGIVWYVPHNNSQFCCKSMGAFWTHSNKYWSNIPFTMYGVIMLIQVAQIFLWVGGDHYLVILIHNNKVSMWEGTKDSIKLINIHNTSIEHHSVWSISFCSRCAFILRVIHLILSRLRAKA